MRLPEGWSKQRFDEISDIANGQVDPREEPYCDYVHIGPDNIESGTGRLSSLKKASELDLISGKYLFDKNAIVYSKIRPNLNKICMPDFEGICSADMYPIWTKQQIQKEYLFYFMSSSFFLKNAIAASGRTGLPKINRQDLGCINVFFPKLSTEQQKIAQILTTWDKAIEKLEALIAAKQTRKKALMQQLLTGKVRFVGFSEEWQKKRLDEIAKVFIGLVTTMTTNYVENGVPLIRNSDIKPNRITKEKLIYLAHDFATANKERKLKAGDIVTVHTGEVGVSAVIDTELDGAIGFATLNTRLKNQNISNEYICWYFNSEHFIKWSVAMSTGDGRQNLNLKDFIKAQIIFPSFAEQQRIAAVLSAADNEIQIHQNELAALKLQKKGLMQQLLTGKVRVKVEAVA